MSASVLRELDDDYEIVVLPNGAQIKRERLTKAQLRIKALKERNRNKKLHDDLLSHANEIREKWSNMQLEKSAENDHSAISYQITNYKKNSVEGSETTYTNKNKTENDKAKSVAAKQYTSDNMSAIDRQKLAIAERSSAQSRTVVVKKRTERWRALKMICLKIKSGSRDYPRSRRQIRAALIAAPIQAANSILKID